MGQGASRHAFQTGTAGCKKQVPLAVKSRYRQLYPIMSHDVTTIVTWCCTHHLHMNGGAYTISEQQQMVVVYTPFAHEWWYLHHLWAATKGGGVHTISRKMVMPTLEQPRMVVCTPYFYGGSYTISFWIVILPPSVHGVTNTILCKMVFPTPFWIWCYLHQIHFLGYPLVYIVIPPP